ncbi:hypothetical protein K439DRAFT_1611959 [Ramaria rubella]|nr:hypothetical protein K439DRAFT_1611959 [Ramaria rubella]
MSQLYNLTANLGRLQVTILPDITESDKEFAKQLILLHAVKTSLWNHLQCLQDELNPVFESTTQSGAGRTLGTKKLQGAIKAIQDRGKGVMSTVDTCNKMLDTLMHMECPHWATQMQLPACLNWEQVVSVDLDAVLWEEMCLRSTWVTLWGLTYEAAPAYVHDPRVRNGIKMVLKLDHIAEEEQQLAEEWQNVLDEFTAAFMLIVCNLIHSRELPDIVVWRLPLSDILKYLEGGGAIEQLLQLLLTFFDTTMNPPEEDVFDSLVPSSSLNDGVGASDIDTAEHT